MIKIICTSEKEKLELIEASDAINRHWATNPKASKDKMTEFLLNLYKNPGNIEVAEKVVVNKSFVYDKNFKKKRSPLPKKWANYKPQIDKAKDEK